MRLKKCTGSYPALRVGAASVNAVGQAGGVLLTGTSPRGRSDRAVSAALGPLTSPWARHNPDKALTDLAIALTQGGDMCSDASLVHV